MRLTFFGHACFGIETLGYRLVLDPFSPQIGYAPLNTKADLVSISHENPKWHSDTSSVGGEWTLYDALEHVGRAWEFDGITLESFPVFEDWPDGGDPVGPNAMVKITSENLRLLHMGDVGHALGDDYIEALGEVDVVFAPVGGPPTIELDELNSFLTELNPSLVLPMHYMIEGLGMSLQPLDAFLDIWSGPVARSSKSEMQLNMEELPSEPTLQILQPLRFKRQL